MKFTQSASLSRLATIIGAAHPHGYPCSAEALRTIKHDIADAIADDATLTDADRELFLRACRCTPETMMK